MRIVLKSVSLNLLEPSGTVQACIGIGLYLCLWLPVGQVFPACPYNESAGSIDPQTWRLCSCVSQEAGELLRAAQVVAQAGVTSRIVTATDTDPERDFKYLRTGLTVPVHGLLFV